MEQLLMILIFALTASMCLRGFVLSDRLSKEQQNKNRAVTLVQNAAELLKNTSGDYEQALLQAGDSSPGDYCICYDRSWEITEDSADAVYTLRFVPVKSEISLLETACIQMETQKEILFSIDVGWQEVSDNGRQ